MALKKEMFKDEIKQIADLVTGIKDDESRNINDRMAALCEIQEDLEYVIEDLQSDIDDLEEEDDK